MEPSRFQALGAVVLLSLCALACSDEQDASQPPAGKAEAAASKPADAWLELKDDTSPADWLINRARQSGQSVGREEFDALNRALSIAVLRLGESGRMIVNRAAQLETMLQAAGHDEKAIQLIPLLTDAIGETGQTEGFGALSQHYYNMRKSGSTSEDALKDLRGRYGPRT